MSEPFLAEIIMCGCNFAPRNWSFCSGQILPINQNQSLYSILGTTYGGDGRTTFGLPELRGRVPVGPGQGSGLNNISQGQKGGGETVTLQGGNLPEHTHTASGTLSVTDAAGNQAIPGGNYIAQDSASRFTAAQTGAMAAGSATAALGNTGNSSPVAIMQPFLAINYIIAIQGLFPSRN